MRLVQPESSGRLACVSKNERIYTTEPLVASLLLVAMPFVPGRVLVVDTEMYCFTPGILSGLL